MLHCARGSAGEGAWSVLTNCRRRWLASSILLSHSLVGPQQILQNQGIDSKSEGRNGCMDAFLASKSAGCLFSGHRLYPVPPAPIDGSKTSFFEAKKRAIACFKGAFRALVLSAPMPSRGPTTAADHGRTAARPTLFCAGSGRWGAIISFLCHTSGAADWAERQSHECSPTPDRTASDMETVSCSPGANLDLQNETTAVAPSQLNQAH